jgi:hypothetical protein
MTCLSLQSDNPQQRVKSYSLNTKVGSRRLMPEGREPITLFCLFVGSFHSTGSMHTSW